MQMQAPVSLLQGQTHSQSLASAKNMSPHCSRDFFVLLRNGLQQGLAVRLPLTLGD